MAASKFTDEELQLLKKTWADLADRSNGKGVDKDTFLQYLPINGLLGERLFVQFDYKKTESLDLDEFVTGLATICRGTRDEKIRFIFDMYAVSDDETVSKAEFATLLNQIPRDVLDHSGCNNKAISRNNSMMPNSTSSASSVLHDSEGEETLNSDNESEAGVVASSPYPGSTSGSVFTSPNYEDEVDAYTNRDVIEK